MLDLYLPGMRGDELCHQIGWKSFETQNVSILMLTAEEKRAA
jgi:DNA-binding response OmpR family regulator